MKPNRILHIYPPVAQHCDGFVVGTPAGLLSLRKAIDRALTQQYAMTEVSCNDGEGYNVFVMGVVEDDIEKRLALPYTASFAQEAREGVVRPHEVLTREKYVELLEKSDGDAGRPGG